MSKLEKVLDEYPNGWQLATATNKRQNQNRTSTPNRLVGQGVSAVRQGQDRPQIRDGYRDVQAAS
jgi:hypothetical protein